MALSPGTRLGVYEIVAPLGAGGMGEVYRGRDTKLQRDVAIKLLPDAFASDPERVARFEREARTLAALNHPHIAQIHGFEQGAGMQALVMELVDGEDLAERIARGPLPIDEALAIGRQVAEALEAAHEQGIIHRDLKPANVKVRADGTVKVLDFGLAKALDARSDSTSASVSLSPTLTTATQAGMVLGTAAYMSPEQARGKQVDKRADIWAFGCVLFEMLAGRRAFDGDEVTDVLAFVITKEPDWSALPAATPLPAVKLLRRCLDKNPRQRLPDIGVARLEIDDSLSRAAGTAELPPTINAVDARTGWRWQKAAVWTIAGMLIGLGAGAIAGRFGAAPAAPGMAMTTLDARIGEGLSIEMPSSGGSTVVLSPDGRRLAFVGQRKGEPPQLYVRKMDELEPTPLSGTAGARSPFFSPDGQWIGYFADLKLKRVAVTGGTSLVLADAPLSRGGTWMDDGSIVFAATATAPLSRVAQSGGAVEPLTQLAQGEVTHRWPHALPGSKAVLFEAHTSRTGHDDAMIVAQTIPGGERKLLHRGGYEPRYLSTGHLGFLREATLFVAPFDLDRVETTSAPTPVLQGILSNTTSGFSQLSISNTGTVAYLPGESSSRVQPIEWVDATGQSTPLRSTASNWVSPAFSPDGRQLVVTVLDPGVPNLWLYDMARETFSPFTRDGGTRPTWTPDGKRITFSRLTGSGGATNLFWKPADSSAEAERISDSARIQFAGAWHPGGKYLAVVESTAANTSDIVVYSLVASAESRPMLGEPMVFANSPSIEAEPAFSPDGRWLAYVSYESGRSEVYVRPFPGPGGRFTISTDGGSYPFWSRTRSEIFFLQLPDRRIMVTPFKADGDVFRAEKPRAWVSAQVAPRPANANPYTMHPDGDHAVFARVPAGEPGTAQETTRLIFNFFDELKRLLPASK